MALLAQDVIVTLICATALALVVRRFVGAVRPSASGERCTSCPKCSTETATTTQPADAPHPMLLLRSTSAPSRRPGH
jgi:hypothetical protein